MTIFLAIEFSMLATKTPSHTSKFTTITTRWNNPPTKGQLKLNIDDSAYANPGIWEIRGVFRDQNGQWVLGFYMHLLHTTTTMTKFLAWRYGLDIAKDNNFNQFSIEIGSSVTIQMLTNDHPFYHNLLDECRSLMEETQLATTLVKIYRDQNAVADKLTKEEARNQVMVSPKLFWQMPHFVTDCVQLDCDGSLTHRRIKKSSIILQDRDVVLINLILAPSRITSTTLFPPWFLMNELFNKKKNDTKKFIPNTLNKTNKKLITPWPTP